MSKLPVFITGNQNKADYLAQTLGMPLEHQKVDLDEIQSASPETVIEHKVRQAYQLLGRPVLVEDTSLSFTALDNLPGPFIKFFNDAHNGLENMCRMLDGFSDRSATASAIYGYYDGVTPVFFTGRVEGLIAQHPRGDGGFGWDAIFEPIGYNGKTRAELAPIDYISVHNQVRDTDGLRTFLQSL